MTTSNTASHEPIQRARRAEGPLRGARTQAEAKESLPPTVRFADAEHRARTVEDAEKARAVVVSPSCSRRGDLAKEIEREVETVLASRGAMPAIVAVDAPFPDVVADQLHRASALPVRGVCLCMPHLGPLALRGELVNDDAEAVSTWIDAAREVRKLRVVVLLDERDREIELRVPRRLGALVEEQRNAPATKIEAQAPAQHVAVATPPVVAPIAETLRPPPSPPIEASARREAANKRDERDEETALAEALATLASTPIPALPALPALEAPPAPIELEDELPAVLQVAPTNLATPATPAPTNLVTPAIAAPIEPEPQIEPHVERVAARLVDSATYRAHAMELDAARGPKPVAVVEKLFAQRYVPLLAPLSQGEADATVRGIAEAWRASFAESYESAFESIRVTGKRPSMVMDAHEIAHKIGRLASARSVKLVMVDSMSYDLGERVAARVGAALDKRAALVEKTVLWSALPSITAVQAHLISRGVEGLKDLSGPASEPDITRGRSVGGVRRERLGPKEVFKLDLVEARLRSQGAGYDERLEALADEVCDVLVKLFETLPPRTLAYVFGDHGFVLGRGINGWATGAATQGGASPEEVLVSGHAWLVDAVQ
ncbi:MAG: hypothetical protein U0271_05325 [Polyangiaceae bacterium]